MSSTHADRFADYIGRTALGRAVASVAGKLAAHVVPNHWSNLFGIVSVACFLVVLFTGFYLMFFYTPASTTVQYNGSYLPLRGVPVSSAFGVDAGHLVRRAGRAADPAGASLGRPAPARLAHHAVGTTFFTGGFRHPRRGNWVLLFLIFVVSLIGGWSGYALPDDMLSGTGLRITEGIVLASRWSARGPALFRAVRPGSIIAHLYPIHVAIVPALLIALVTARAGRLASRAAAVLRSRPHEPNTVGVPMLPRGRPSRRAHAHRHGAALDHLGGGDRESDLAVRTGLPVTQAPAASPTGTPASSTERCGWCRPAGKSSGSAGPGR